MNSLRKAPWFPLMSLLLLAVLLPVQAAGCCKLGMLLGSAEPVPAGPAKEMAADHSCCPKPAPESAPVPEAPARDCEGSQGCCLEGVAGVDPALASTPAPILPVFNVAFLAVPHETVAAAPARPALALPADSGPPLYLALQRLLI